MKKIVNFVVLVLSFALVHAQVLEKRNLKPIESVIDEQGRTVDKETKVLRLNRNQNFKSEAKDASEIALSRWRGLVVRADK
jgi:hypothetical protein